MNALSLDRVVTRYRSDVHQLAPAASTSAIRSLEDHLLQPLPEGLRAFLNQHNGARLFRGALRIRSTSEVAVASEASRSVVLFADGNDQRPHGFAACDGGFTFGPWDGRRLLPMHSSFDGWMEAQIAVLETRVTRAEDVDALRFEADPGDVFQLVRAGMRALQRGLPEDARKLLLEATRKAPRHVDAWQRLGDALAASDRTAARRAWLQAFRNFRLPLPYPGAPTLDPEVIRPLALAFGSPEEWERELVRFLSDRVEDARSEEEAAVVVAVAAALAATRLRAGRREAAREALVDAITRCERFTHPTVPWRLVRQVAQLDADLGHHDEAERRIRQILREGPESEYASALLLLGALAVTRHEPWAEELLDDARRAGLADAEQVMAAALRVERGIRCDEPPERLAAALEAGTAAARRAGSPVSTALALFAEGDWRRARSELDLALERYRGVIALLPNGLDPELFHRSQLRIGDLHMERNEHRLAAAQYRNAAEGFAAHELPLREAWALLRLGRLTRDAALLQRAESCFLAAGLAAGVAAVDSARGDPGIHLLWHLEQATEHASRRQDAQRSRPPLVRADAERPERRLGAHRLAIAACDVAVVRSLAAEMNACARGLEAGMSQTHRYVAAVDLVAGHRSFEAATVLLDHLLHQRVDGVALRALQGAVCRSPNAILVDGLLSTVEHPADRSGHEVAAAAEILGLRQEAAAVRALAALAEPGNRPVARKAAVTALGRIGVRSARNVLLDALSESTLAEAAALALLMLGDRHGIDFHARALAEGRLDLSDHPGELVGRYGGASHLLLLLHAAEDADARALGALEGLGLLGDCRAIPVLLQALHGRSLQHAEVAAGALQILTGHREDVEEGGYRNRWIAWWERNRSDFADGVRYREGRPLDAGFLIERMAHDDAWTRRTAYDELVITTGCRLPFDAEGPWRVQQAHLSAWRQWWAQHREQFPAGKWWLDGRQNP